MPTLGITKTTGTCPICKKAFKKGVRAYQDVSKSEKNSVVHEMCWVTLRRERAEGDAASPPKTKGTPVQKSKSLLDPPF